VSDEKYVDPKVLVREEVLGWLTSNPGPHKIEEIADALAATGMRRGYVYSATFVLKDADKIGYNGDGYFAL
jgi:hypothetical protein